MHSYMHTAGFDATKAAKALADLVTTAKTEQDLTLAGHARFLETFGLTITAVSGDHGLLSRLLSFIADKQLRATELPTGADQTFSGLLSDTYESTCKAIAHVPGTETIDTVWRRVAGDAAQRTPRPSPAANTAAALIASAREASEAIGHFQDTIEPGDGPIADVVSALTNSATIVLALKTAYLREAELIAAAYTTAQVAVRPPAPSEALTSVATTLQSANHHLATAVATARKAADRERHILNAI